VRKLKGTDFGIISPYGRGFKLDVWRFPKNWKDIHPFNDKSMLKLRDKFNIALEIKKENGHVLLAKLENINLTVFKCSILYSQSYAATTFRWNDKPRIIAPFFWDAIGKEGAKNRALFNKEINVNVEDLKEMASVTVELSEK
jgi:hypothetical protein